MRLGLSVLLAGAASLAGPAAAQERPSIANSFPLGTGGDTACRVQARGGDTVASGLFDRVYAVVCRDAVAPIGKVYAVRDPQAALQRLEQARDPQLTCAAASPLDLREAGAAQLRACTTPDDLRHDVITFRQGKTLYAAEGLSGYRPALALALRSLAADRVIDEPVTIARTEQGDPASFARAQAGALDPELTLVEGYRRNAAGAYAEAAEFFDTLIQSAQGAGRAGTTEYLVNRALQKSNLGDFNEADALFAQAAALPAEPVVARLRRNYLAMHRLNQRRPQETTAALDAPVSPVPALPAGEPVIDQATAQALNGQAPLAAQLGLNAEAALTPSEKAALLDAQAVALRGVVARLEGRRSDANAAFLASLGALGAIRNGQITSIARLRASIMSEQAEIAEEAGDRPRALQLLEAATAIVDQQYPGSAAASAARARLAAATARGGDSARAVELYDRVIADLGEAGISAPGLESLIEPYFALLSQGYARDPAMAERLFLASQTLVRPGVANTQAVLARELSSGDSEAARLFRLSVNTTREAEAARVELARFAALPEPGAADQERIGALRERVAELQEQQASTVAKLSEYPSYRALSNRALSLADLRAQLRPGEVYWKLSSIGPSLYALLVTGDRFAAWKIAMTPTELDARVDAIRKSISVVEDGETVTYPFDVATTRALYIALAGPEAATIASAKGVIFEPDGGMQRLPAKLLIVDQTGVDRYLAAAKRPDGDPFDFTGIEWLGKRTPVTVAVSARAFRDVRTTGRSKAARAYLGMGENAPVSAFTRLTAAPAAQAAIDCNWPLAAWGNPISAAELRTAQTVIGPARSTLLTDAAFTDQAIMQRRDLNQYRILHFATHGLVEAPRPECPARPALLTSFGGQGSDGLLSFREIYDLDLDADLVILSACNTASAADIAATREAGVTSGGGDPLDGLVRAFVGAGARTVIASHWPAPDDYQATERLIGGLFSAAPGTTAAEALMAAGQKLMADPATSHPYYWAAFVLIGDGAKPVIDAN